MLVSLQSDGIGRRDFGGWSLAVYFVVFICGYFIAINPKSRSIIEKNRITSLIIGIITSTVLLIFQIGHLSFSSLNEIANGAIIETCRSVSLWSWLMAILGFGSKYLDFSNKFLNYANEAVMPFYVFHQTVIIIIGFYVIKLDINVIFQYLIIFVSSLGTILLVYELFIRRINILRFIFGLKRKS